MEFCALAAAGLSDVAGIAALDQDDSEFLFTVARRPRTCSKTLFGAKIRTLRRFVLSRGVRFGYFFGDWVAAGSFDVRMRVIPTPPASQRLGPGATWIQNHFFITITDGPKALSFLEISCLYAMFQRVT